MLGLTIAALGMVAASARVIGWMLVALAFAALLHPFVDALARRMPRALALAVVMIATIAIAGFIGYRVVNDINVQLHELQNELPRAARAIERSDRFGKAARDSHLSARVTAFVRELPARLRGGSTADALRSAATRGVAFLATTVLTIFLIIYGPGLLSAGARQLPPDRARRARAVASAAYARAWRYVAGSLGMSLMAGLLAYGCATMLELPGAAPLAVWMALVDVIPVLGVVLGALPLVLLAGAVEPARETAIVAVILIGWQVFETLYLQGRVERRSLHIGPFVTIAVAMVGLELYGIGGALMALVGTVVVAATIDELIGPGAEAESVASSR
ncbi:MAG: hypothetical protein QOI47_2606 [Actinomycetota bacterium]|nr:hypothetical protein [Actinomycetota bacterium]